MTTEHDLEEGRRNLRHEMAPTGIGPSGSSRRPKVSSRARPTPSRRPTRSGSCSGAASSATASPVFSIIVLAVPGRHLLRRQFFAPFKQHRPGPAARPGVAERHSLVRHRRARPGPAQPAALRRPDLVEDRLRGRDHLDRDRHARRRVAGYFGRSRTRLLMRITDLFLVVPEHRGPGHGAPVLRATPTRSSSWCSPACSGCTSPASCAARCCRSRRRSSSRRHARRARRADADHRAPHPAEHHRPDHGEHDARRRGRDHRRVDAVVPRASASSRRRRRGGSCSRTPRATSATVEDRT